MRKTRIESLLLFLVAAAAIWDGVHIVASNRETYGAERAGGALVILGSILACLATVYLFQTRPAQSETGFDWRANGELRRVLIAVALLAVYTFAWEYMGYALSTALFLAVCLRISRSFKWVPLLAGSIAAAFGGAYLWRALGMMLPQGPLPWP